MLDINALLFARHHAETSASVNVNDLTTTPASKSRHAKKPAANTQSSRDVIPVSEASAVTEAVVNLVVSLPVLLSSKDLVVNNGGGGHIVDGIGSGGVSSLNGMEMRVLDGSATGDGIMIPSLSAGTAYKLLVDVPTSDCGSGGGPVLLLDGTDMNFATAPVMSSVVESETLSSSAVSLLPATNSCSSLLLLGEVADGQLPATPVVL